MKQSGQHLYAGEFAGALCERAAQDLGLPAGIAVGSGVIDAYAGWIGTVGAKVDLSNFREKSSSGDHKTQDFFTRLAAVAGTSTCHLVMSSSPIFVPGVWGPYRDTVLPNCWMAEGGQSATGQLLHHILKTHPATQQAEELATLRKMDIFTFLNDHLKEMVVTQQAQSISYLTRHFFFYGDLFGNRSPLADSNMTGSIVGLTSDISVDSLAILYHSALEFIALQTRQILEAMNDAGHSITSIFMSGSQCQNSLLVQLISSVCEVPVVVPRYVNAAVCHGAAMLGAKAASVDSAGRTTDLLEIMNKMSKPGRVFYQTSDCHERDIVRAKYQVFLDLCHKQQEYRKLMDEVVTSQKASK